MSQTTLHSLDALILTVRDTESRRLAQEAVFAYQAGACRAAILSIWVAVCADIISKIRELAAGGNGVAQTEVTKLEGCIRRNDLRGLQQFENGLIELAQKTFDMFLSHESTDLIRLREDRNLCAHPAFVSDDTLFSPTPELVRAHIAHAILHLLSRPPIQGKQIVTRLNRNLLGGSFPSESSDIEIAMRDNYLASAKMESIITLVKSLATSLVSSNANNYVGKEKQIAAALAAIGRIHPAIYEDHLRPLIERQGRDLSDDNLLALCFYMEYEPRLWNWVGSSGRARILAKIGNTQFLDLTPAFRARHVCEIGDGLLMKIKSDYPQSLHGMLSGAPCKAFVSEALNIYSESGSFATAEKRGIELLLPHGPYLTSADIHTLDKLIRANPYNQIRDAAGTLGSLTSLFELTQKTLPDSAVHWGRIANYIIDVNDPERYNEFHSKLRAAGVSVPDLVQAEDNSDL